MTMEWKYCDECDEAFVYRFSGQEGGTRACDHFGLMCDICLVERWMLCQSLAGAGADNATQH